MICIFNAFLNPQNPTNIEGKKSIMSMKILAGSPTAVILQLYNSSLQLTNEDEMYS